MAKDAYRSFVDGLLRRAKGAPGVERRGRTMIWSDIGTFRRSICPSKSALFKIMTVDLVWSVPVGSDPPTALSVLNEPFCSLRMEDLDVPERLLLERVCDLDPGVTDADVDEAAEVVFTAVMAIEDLDDLAAARPGWRQVACSKAMQDLLNRRSDDCCVRRD